MAGSSATLQSEVQRDEKRDTRSSAFAAIIGRSHQPGSPKDFFKAAVGDLASHFGSPCVAGTLRLGPEVVTEIKTIEGVDRATWQDVYQPLLLEAETERRSRARVYNKGRGDSGAVVVLSTPLVTASGDTIGAVVVFARCEQPEQADTALHELRACAGLISSALGVVRRNSIPNRAQSQELETALIKAADYGSLRRLAFAITNNLRTKVGCDQVALSRIKRGRVTILSVSGQDTVKPRSPGTHNMRQAMEECADRGRPILYQNNPKWDHAAESTGHRLHRAWHESAGNASVLSIPLFLADTCVGVISMRRAHDKAFIEDEVTKITSLVAPFGAVLPLLDRADRSLVAHGADNLHALGRWLVAPTGWGRKILAAIILCAGAFFFLGSGTWSVTVPCAIAPERVIHVATPFDGVILEAPVRAGAEVAEGEALVRFDTSDLELRRAELRSELAATQVEIDRALRDKDVSGAALAEANRQTLAVQLQVVEDSIDRATVRAPFDARVIEGDLRERIGQSTTRGEPLLKIAPIREWRVELRVPERLADDVEAGLAGRFISNARPDVDLPCTIASVRPAAEVIDARNVFVAEAPITDAPDWMRIGMEGVARIDVGKRKWWWIVTHRAVDFLHMRLWL